MIIYNFKLTIAFVLLLSLPIYIYPHDITATETTVKATAEIPQFPPYNNSNLLLPDNAYDMSFIPGWSGSWNAEFNGKGLIYQPGKIFGALLMSICVVGIIITPFGPEDDGTKARSIGWGCIFGAIGFFIYYPFATSDAEYSSKYVNSYNARKFKQTLLFNNNTSNNVSFNTFLITNNANSNLTKYDGIGIRINYSLGF